MSDNALKRGARKMMGKSGDIDAQLSGLEQAVEFGSGRLPEAPVDQAGQVADKARERLSLSPGHTVVTLAGATGSGKSSLFNSLSGLELAAVGVRRPTSSSATACLWGAEGSLELMDWLELPPRYRVTRDSSLDGPAARKAHAELDGLVLLDLPDHDSTEVHHHIEMERLIARADLMVWVLDPQKYADAALHRRFLQPMAEHQGSMLIVLNQIDLLSRGDLERITGDIRRLLNADGLTDVPILPVSATSGRGMDELRRAIAKRVATRAAMRKRLSTEISEAANRLTELSGDAEPPKIDDSEARSLDDAVATVAGVPVVVDAVQRAATMRGQWATGWPITSWFSRLRPDPLRRLHLDLSSGDRDLVMAARSSLPEATPVQQAQVDAQVRRVGERASQGLTRPWAAAVRKAATERSSDLGDRLDRAMSSSDLEIAHTPWWAKAFRVVQWVLLTLALAGLAWLVVLGAMSFMRIPQPSTPRWLGMPIPTLMLIVGVAAGLLLALLGRFLVRADARSRARRVDRRLREAVSDVTAELVLTPVHSELEAYAKTRAGLRAARSA